MPPGSWSVRRIDEGDEDWFSVVRWTIYALVAAEELGIRSANVDAMKGSTSAEVRRFLGVNSDFGRRLGLSADWTQRMIKQVGNYGEIFERHLGLKSPLKLERRLNDLATKGGLHYVAVVPLTRRHRGDLTIWLAVPHHERRLRPEPACPRTCSVGRRTAAPALPWFDKCVARGHGGRVYEDMVDGLMASSFACISSPRSADDPTKPSSRSRRRSLTPAGERWRRRGDGGPSSW